MADKSQNITINYKFNTQEVDKATATLNQANAASNRLQQAGAKGASAITQEFQKSRKTILDMQTALTRLKSIIDITSDPAKLKQLSNEYKNIKTQLDNATKSAYGLNNAMKQQGNAVTAAAGKFGQLYGAVQTVVWAAIVRQIANVTLEMARLAGNAEGIERAFERSFPNSFDLMNQLREATKGTVTDFELMQRTLQATNLGVAVKELPVLFEFAAVRAQQTGESVDYLVDSIVRGIGRKSPLILDNLGLSATRLKEKFDGASLASQSVADVTRGVAEIAREELEKMGGHVETSATRVARLESAWTQLRINFAKRIDSSAIIQFFTDAANGASAALKTQKELRDESAKMRAATEFASLQEHQLREERMENGKVVKTNSQDLINAIQNEIRERIKLIEQSKVEVLIQAQKLKALAAVKVMRTEDRETAKAAILEESANIRANISFYQETIKLLRAYFQELTKVDEKQLVTIKTLRDQLKELQDQREEATFIGDTAELDRLERESLRLEDRILKIADNIEWQKKWSQQNERDKLAQMELTKAIEESANAVEKLRKKFADGDIAFSTGDLLGDVDATETLDMDALEEGLTEVADTVNQSLGEEFLIRLRLGFQGKGGDTSEIQAMLNEELKKLGVGTFDILTDQFHSIVDAELASYEQRLANLQAFYDNQMLLAGDNDRAKQQLRIKEERDTARLRAEMARKEKQAKRTHVLIDIAAGIAKAFATYAWPYSLIPAAFVAAQGASQLAIINRQPTNFAKGVIDLKGPGTATSDSIPANLSRGESVMTAWETRMAGDVLKDIRAKKLDNRVLRQLKEGRTPVQSDNFNDERIIKAIKEQKYPDVEEVSNIVYKTRKYNDDYRKRVRSRSMGL